MFCGVGMLKVDGLLQAGCKMWDTPGVAHHYQLSSKLNAEEVRRSLSPVQCMLWKAQVSFGVKMSLCMYESTRSVDNA